MIYYTSSFKRKLGLISLVVLASLVCPHEGFAMQEEGKKRSRNDEGGEGEALAKRTRTTTTTTTTVDPQTSDAPAEVTAVQRTLLTEEEVDTLIAQAKRNDVEAQNKLISAVVSGVAPTYLTPEKIGFLDWKSQNSEETLQTRCGQNDGYAFFVIRHFEKIGHNFPELLTQVQERAFKEIPPAQYNLANMYTHGTGVEKNEVEAFRLFTHFAKKGSAKSQTNVAMMYAHGTGVEKNMAEAVHLLTLAANQGYAPAQTNVAIMYAQGTGVEKNMAEAARFLTLAANQGYPPAQTNLAMLYAAGDGVEKNMAEAVRLLTLAANQGFGTAQNNLAIFYQRGQGVKQNMAEAYRLCTLAAKQGFALAQLNLASMYEKSVPDVVEKNQIEALHWLMKAKNPKGKNRCAQFLLLNADALITGESFQDMLSALIPGKNSEIDEALDRLLCSHQHNVILNTERGCDSVFAIPPLGKMYESVAELGAETLCMLKSLVHIKPGFMVTAVTLSEEMKKALPQQITPFFSLDEVDGISCLTMGEKNVQLVQNLLKTLDKFEEADKNLQNISHLYAQGLEFYFGANAESLPVLESEEEQHQKFAELKKYLNVPLQEIDSEPEFLRNYQRIFGQLMVRQRLAQIFKNTDEVLHFEDDSEDGFTVRTCEYFGSLFTITDGALLRDEEKFSALHEYLKQPLQEIEEERTILRNLKGKITSTLARGTGSRNADFWDEYAFMKQ